MRLLTTRTHDIFIKQLYDYSGKLGKVLYLSSKCLGNLHPFLVAVEGDGEGVLLFLNVKSLGGVEAL